MKLPGKSRLPRRLRNRPGQGLVEFVLIAPLLLILFLGLVEFARAWNIRHVVTDAAREGARSLAVENAAITNDSVMQIIHSALVTSGIDTTSAAITIDDGGSQRGSQARVTIELPYTIGFLQTFLGWAIADAQFTIASTFVMRNE